MFCGQNGIKSGDISIIHRTNKKISTEMIVELAFLSNGNSWTEIIWNGFITET